MREHKLFKINQGAILQNAEGRVLILRKNGKWMLPGGRMEEGEDWLHGLKREMQEETGIVDFAIVRPASVGTVGEIVNAERLLTKANSLP